MEQGIPAEMPILQGSAGSDCMVDVIQSLGLSQIAANPGTSFRGLHESLIKYSNLECHTCADEEASVAMAHGYAKIEGRPMLVVAHGTVGLQHASMAIYNAWCDRVPIYIMAIRSTPPSAAVPPYGAFGAGRGRHGARFRQVGRYARLAVRLCAEVFEAIRDEDWSLASTKGNFVGGWPQRLWDMSKHYPNTGVAGGSGIGFARLRRRARFGRMIWSEKSATFRDHALSVYPVAEFCAGPRPMFSF
jgi:Thiamine pyrophosphate enzyme, N-terminal TPP binding domain